LASLHFGNETTDERNKGIGRWYCRYFCIETPEPSGSHAACETARPGAQRADALRLVVAGALEAVKALRRTKAYADMPMAVAALRPPARQVGLGPTQDR
jgi:hypothetical protein